MRRRFLRRASWAGLIVASQIFSRDARARPVDEGTPATVTGKVTVIEADDFAHHRAERFYVIEDSGTGKRYNLHFKEKAPNHLHTGSTIKVTGLANGNEIVAAANDPGIQSLQAASMIVTGEQKTAILGINFSDTPMECSLDSIDAIMFGSTQSVDQLYQQMSHSNVWFTGAEYGPYTIPFASTGTCDYQAWASAADAAAQAQGVDLSVYNHKVYVFPQENPCGWAGLGTIGGDPGQAWISYCGLADVYAHELGHNLTLHHASTDLDNSGTNDCEYCDVSDFMGYSGIGLREINGPHMDQMGWLPAIQTLLATNNMVINLAPLEFDPQSVTQPQLLKIAKPSADEFYYFSYRTQVSCDSDLDPQYVKATNVHHYQGSGAIETYFITALQDSGTFTDPAIGLIVTQLDHDDNSVTLSVSFGGPPAVPEVEMTPTNQFARPAATLVYSMTITNTDGSGSSPATFYINPTVPAGWTAAVSPSSLTLSPGQADSVSVAVTSSSDISNGAYTVSIALTDNLTPIHDTSVKAMVSVDLRPPTAPKHLSARRSHDTVQLRWSAAKDAIGISDYSIWRNEVIIADTSSNRYIDADIAAGQTNFYYVMAEDRAGNISLPSNTVKIRIPPLNSSP